MEDFTPNAPFGQSVGFVKEWSDLLSAATDQGLIAPAGRDQIEAHRLMGTLTADRVPDAVQAALRAGPAAEMALDAVAPAFSPGDVIELRALDPAGGGGLSLCGRLDIPTERDALERFIRDHIGRRNLYIGCNPRRADMAGTNLSASASDVPTRRNVVLDLDLKDAPSVDPDWTRTVDALRGELTPVMILNSGNGFHVWLALDPVSGPDVPASTAQLAAAMARIGADNIADPPRIVRLPFTPNLPNAKKRERGATVRLAVTC
jgi:hypothetical protein